MPMTWNPKMIPTVVMRVMGVTNVTRNANLAALAVAARVVVAAAVKMMWNVMTNAPIRVRIRVTAVTAATSPPPTIGKKTNLVAADVPAD